MAHVIAVDAGSIIALVDPACPASPVPITAMAHMLSESPPAFRVPLSWANMVQLSTTLPGAIYTETSMQYLTEQVMARAPQHREELHISLPDGREPYFWQVDAATSFARIGSAMLSDSPGTGKTASTLLALGERQQRHGDAFPALIVVPASVVSSWAAEAKAWLPGASVCVYRGPRRNYAGQNLVITSYDIAMRDEEKLKKLGLASIVADEHHMIKNRDAKRTKAMTNIGKKIPLAIALSGTPISHSPVDVFPVLRILESGTFPAYDRFEGRYIDVVADDYGTTPIGLRQDRAPEFYRSLAGQWRRVDKAEVLSQLPPKVYSKREVEMPAQWRKAYNDMADSMSADFPSGVEVDVMDVLSQMSILMSLTLGPGTIETTPNKDPEKRDHIHFVMQEWSWKLPVLEEILDERPDAQVLVFSHSRQMIDQATRRLTEKGITCSQIVGGQSATKRDAAKDAFQSGQAQVCLVTTQAGGVGLTLTAASTVVFLSRPFSLIDATQAEDRAHRIGSERHESIEIIDVVTTKSIDQSVANILRVRGASLEDFLSGAPSVSTIRKLMKGEL